MGMTQQQKAAFNQQFIFNNEVGWRERYVHEGGNIYNLESEEGIESFNQNFIYNPEVGWRERTEAERSGPGLQAVGNGLESAGRILVHTILVPIVDVAPSVLKYLTIGVGAGAAGLVAYNGFQVVLKQVEGV